MSATVSSVVIPHIRNVLNSNYITGSPTQAYPEDQCVQDPPHMTLTSRSVSEPVPRMIAMTKANMVATFFLQQVTSSQSAFFHFPIVPFQDLSAIDNICPEDTETVKDLYSRYPKLATMDLHAKERIDQALSPLKTQGPVDADFIKKMVEQHKMSENEAVVAYHCRKWAQLNGFPLNPL